MLLYQILQCQILPPDKNLAAIELFFTAGLWPANFFGGFSVAVIFLVAAAKFGGWGGLMVMHSILLL